MAGYLDTLLALATQNDNGLPPIPPPAAPVPMPGITQPPFGAPLTLPAPPSPDAAPMAPAPALDTNFINQFSGPAPTMPVQQQPGRLQTIGNVLLGISAGLQGRGGEFAAGLREERERPIRDYQRQLEQFNQRRAAGTEIATRRQEQAQDRTQRTADRQADREFQVWLRNANITDEEAQRQARQAFELNKIRETERLQRQQDEAKQQAARDKQRNDIYADLIKGPNFAPTKVANEIADNIVFGKPLSASTEKWRSVQVRKAEAQLANLRGGGSGGASAGPVMARLEGGQLVPVSVVDNGAVMLGGNPVNVVEYVGGKIPPTQQPRQQASTPFSVSQALGPKFDMSRWMNPSILPTQMGAQPMSPTPAPQSNLTRAKAKGRLVREGFSSKEADAELDRLGIMK